MNLFVLAEEATAASTQQGGGIASSLMLIIPLGAIILFMFFSSRGAKKREKEAAELRNSLEPGDEVSTIGGIIGRVVSTKEDTVVIETGGDRSRIRIKRAAIAEVEKLSMEAPAAESKDAPTSSKSSKK